MDHGVNPSEYSDVVEFLATAGIVVPLFKRLKISPILGFLAAGVALGPFGLGALAREVPWVAPLAVSNPKEIAELAEFGVVFLLFMVGLELSWERLRLLRHQVFGLGAAQTLLSLAAIAAIAGLAGQGLASALAIGAALALSSTAIILPSLAEAKRLHSDTGRAVFSVLLFQDLAVAPILVGLSLLGGHPAESGAGLVLRLAPAILAPAAILLAGRLVLRPMMKSVARAKSEELFMAASLLVVIGAGLAAAAAGLSMALGAFIAGLLLAETEYRHEVEVVIEPFKGLLLGLFFLSVGIGLDLDRLAQQPVLILGAAAGLVLLKALIAGGAAAVFGLKPKPAVEAGLMLGAGGEFAFVVLAAAAGSGVVPKDAGAILTVAATLSMFAIPALSAAGRRLARGAQEAPALAPAAQPTGEARVLVIGYGRVGLMVADMLDRHHIPWVAADRDARLVEAGRRAGKPVFYGDASRGEFLMRIGLGDARAAVVTMDAFEAAEAVVAAARQARPDMVIVARARDARQAGRLYELGATEAVPETMEASLQLSEALLVDLGIPMGLVIASVHEKRDEIRKELNRPEALGAKMRRARDRIGGGGRP
ncbi:MAG: cation:proton antiporter domain-containing protein [Caulobacteraceae bacterium]